jgi:hypothetical protein
MSPQADYIVANGTGAAVRSDLNGQLAAIVSNNSGATEPATMYAYQWWADTTAGLLKIRNAANNAWITLRELDGTLLMEDGTAAAPGLSFASDPDSGIFRGGANEFGIATNGVERVEFGTTEVVFNDGGANYDFRIEGDTNTSLFFVDASAEAVGIGIASPGYLLHLNGSTPSVAVHDSGANGTRALVEATNSAVYFGSTYSTSNVPTIFSQAGASGGIERMRIDTSGRLLVGTSTNIGSENIQIGTAHGTLGLYKFANNDDGGELTLANSRNGTVGSQTIVNNNDFLGRIFFRGSDGSAFLRGADIVCQVDGTPGTNDMPGRLVFATTASGASTPTERMRIRADGQIVCVATYDNTTASAANVHIFGDRSLGRSTSSIRYKTNVETLQDSYADSILDCRPVWYQSKCTNDNPDWGYWGFIAEEVEQVDPRLCHYGVDENGEQVVESVQ